MLRIGFVYDFYRTVDSTVFLLRVIEIEFKKQRTTLLFDLVLRNN